MTWAWEPWSLQDEEVIPALTLTMALRRAPMGLLLLRDANDGVLRVAVTQGLNPDETALLSAHGGGGIPAIVDRFCNERHRISIRDVRTARDNSLAPVRALGELLGFRGMEVLPLERRQPAALGAVALLFRSPLRLSPRSTRLLGSATTLITLALDNARLRAEEQTQRRVAERRAYDRLQFLSRINHELRTPLQSITGYIELLGRSEESTTSRQREILEHIQDSKQVLLSIIDSVASLGRLEAGRMIYSIGGVNIADMLARVSSVVAPIAKKQGVELVVDMPPRGLLAHGDHGKIAQILINLVTNAVKFTPAKGTVRLETRQVGSSIDFVVKDEGPGIPEDNRAAIFEPWVQFDQRRNSPLAGYGLGLAISREFALAMKGTLHVENAKPPETGAIFTFSIRVHRADRPAWTTRSPLIAAPLTDDEELPDITGLDTAIQSPGQAIEGSA